MVLRTYLDSGVLLEAWRGQGEIYIKAISILDDPNRALVISDFLRLETLPKPTFHKKSEEVAFLTAIFEQAVETVESSTALTAQAVQIASKHDLTPVDALHISAAILAKVDEFVTSEKATKPMFRVTELKVTSLQHSD